MYIAPHEKIICPGWIRGPKVADGGNQAHTHLARRADDSPETYAYVYKTLKRQNEDILRTRFFLETASLRALEHPRIPKLVHTNAEKYKEKEDLFLITEFIDGQDASSLAVTFDEAIELTIALLELLEYCHSIEIYHRDIKPCHVIVKDKNFKEPYLIDFGLAYTPFKADGATTAIGEGKGNKFIIGPEHLPGRAYENRGPTADIMQSIGVLFYLIYQREPGLINDENRRKPHERPGIVDPPELPEWKANYLQYIWNKSFTWEPHNRWMSCTECIGALSKLRNDGLSPSDELRIASRAIVSQSDVHDKMLRNTQFATIQTETLKIVARIARVICEECGDVFRLEFHEVPNCLLRFLPAHLKRSAFDVTVAVTKSEDKFAIAIRAYNGDPPSMKGSPRLLVTEQYIDGNIDFLNIEVKLTQIVLQLVRDSLAVTA